MKQGKKNLSMRFCSNPKNISIIEATEIRGFTDINKTLSTMSARESLRFNIKNNLQNKNVCTECFHIDFVTDEVIIGEGWDKNICVCKIYDERTYTIYGLDTKRTRYCILKSSESMTLKKAEVFYARNYPFGTYLEFMRHHVIKKYFQDGYAIEDAYFSEDLRVALFYLEKLSYASTTKYVITLEDKNACR